MSSYVDDETIDPWDDTPAWEQSDEDGDEDDRNNVNVVAARDAHAYAARHTLILIDTHPSMFEPCIQLTSSNDEDSDCDQSETKNNDDDYDSDSDSSTTIDEEMNAFSRSRNKRKESQPSLLTTPFDASLMAVERLLHHKVHTVATSRLGKRDGVGVILFGTPDCASNDYEEDDKHDEGEDERENENERSDGNSKEIHHCDNREEGDEEDEEEEEEEKHANESLKVLIKLTPPGVDQIKTIRSCLPPEFYHSNQAQKWHNNDNDGLSNNKRERDLYIELFGTKSNVMMKSKSHEGEEDSESDDEDKKDEDDEEGKTYCSLRPALHEATRTFANAKCVKKATSTASIDRTDAKSIWIFTNQDNPIPSYLSFENERDLLLTAASDVFDNDQEIHLWTLPSKMRKAKFDKSIFYDEIIQNDDNDNNSDDEFDCSARFRLEEGTPVHIDMNEGEDGVANINLEHLLETIGRRWNKVRKSQSLPLLLPDWNLSTRQEVNTDVGHESTIGVDEGDKKDDAYPGIMLDLYRTVRKKSKPTAVTIDARTKKKTNKVTQRYSKDNGEIVSMERIRNYTEFGGEQVLISKDEVLELKKRSNGNPTRASLILLGFKPMPTTYEAMSTFTLVDKSIFAYPNDYFVKGSKKAFATLHTSMIRKNVIGIGELLLRVTAVSRLVAIVPQQEDRRVEYECDDEEIFKQIAPPGFLLIPLAFEDDVREMPRKADTQPEKAMIEAAIELIRHQNIEESIEIGRSFENPVLKMFWNYIESVALGIPLDEDCSEGGDTTMNIEGILSVAGPKIDAFVNTIPEDSIRPVDAKLPKKRKVPKVVPDETGIDWNQEYEMDTFYQLTVDDLKAYLRSNGLKVSGRKDEIIERIKSHMRDNKEVEE